jgi:hypothetical protein
MYCVGAHSVVYMVLASDTASQNHSPSLFCIQFLHITLMVT